MSSFQLLRHEFDTRPASEQPPVVPQLLSHHDEIADRMNGVRAVDGLDPLKAELQMLGFSTIAQETQVRSPSTKSLTDRAARLQELVHFVTTGGLSQAGACPVLSFNLMLPVSLSFKFNLSIPSLDHLFSLGNLVN